MTLNNPVCTDELLLYRVSRVLAAGGNTVIRLCEGQLGITWREWRIIGTLRPGGIMLSSELAQQTQLDRARTSRCISSLLTKGFIQRQTVLGDQRKAAVSLTETGRALYEAFFPVVAKLNIRLIQALSQSEIATLDRALAAIQIEAEKIQGEGGLPKANRRRTGRRD